MTSSQSARISATNAKGAFRRYDRVVDFDDQGYALVFDQTTGRLVRAVDVDGFEGFTEVPRITGVIPCTTPTFVVGDKRGSFHGDDDPPPAEAVDFVHREPVLAWVTYDNGDIEPLISGGNDSPESAHEFYEGDFVIVTPGTERWLPGDDPCPGCQEGVACGVDALEALANGEQVTSAVDEALLILNNFGASDVTRQDVLDFVEATGASPSLVAELFNQEAHEFHIVGWLRDRRHAS